MYAISKKRFESKSRYVESYHGKQTIKQYEGSTKGKQTRKNFESKRILNNYESDTGFNIICCSCNEYKSQQSCVNILLRGEKGNRFTEEEEKEYLIKDPNLNISLDGHYYVCKTCLNQIKNKKKPKRNDCDVLQYYDFPQHLFDEVKEKCNKERELQSEVLLNSNLRISKSSVDEYRLNKLEQFIFKNPIPFVRIANCKMGRYLKVQGNLILMSSDIEHSMSKILPCDQKIIPVSLKRKLSYKGYYIEEWVDVDKIEVYFNWLKRNNPFFQDFQLNKEKIIMHEENLIEGVEEYLNTNQNMIDDEIDKDNISVESAEEYEALCGEQIGKLIEIKDEINVQHYDSILCNKYEHELHEESVSKRYADIINEYEIMQNIDNNFVDDFTQEDQYMYEKDEENITESPTKPAEISEEVKPFNVQQVNKKAKNRIKNVKKKIEKINIAPGEQGNFVKWGEDVFLEERCFPHLFPYGVGGYMSTALDGKNPNMGFTNYVRHRLLHVDSRFRNDTVYVFFLLLVKELVELQRSKETYLRQARRMPDLNINTIKNLKHENLERYNRSFQVFKNLRGSSPYYEHSKKNLMACLRQRGCPSVFLTVACAEYKWDKLIKEILEVKERRRVDLSEITLMNSSEKNKLLGENAIISTLHFQKRMDKLFSYFKNQEAFKPFLMRDYYLRVEFQARGAPHVHCLLWLEEQVLDNESNKTHWKPLQTMFFEDDDEQIKNEKIKNIERYAEKLIYSSLTEAKCSSCHEKDINKEDVSEIMDETTCKDCELIKTRASTFNNHICGFSCFKRKKTISIKETEGHGRLDNKIEGEEIVNHLLCRFKYPQFPMGRTTFIPGISKSLNEEDIEMRKNNFRKIRKFLIRQTGHDGKREDNENWKKFNTWDFHTFLFEVGMFSKGDNTKDPVAIEKANQKYLEALSASIKGNGAIFSKREPKDVFTNNFNPQIMQIHEANHDIQLVSDPYACAEYVCDYMTKAEGGMSKVLQSINDDGKDLSKMQLLNKLASALDKHREVSIQEATYRLLGLPMIKSSVIVKYVNTCHPDKRDGLLKGNLEELEDGESPFHNNIFTYYQNRPTKELGENDYDDGECLWTQFNINSWEEMCLADFVSCYDLLYGSKDKNQEESFKERLLLNNKGKIKIRQRRAILRYYLKYENDMELKRAKLLLFYPFRDEMKEIHEMDIEELYDNQIAVIEKNQAKFENKFDGGRLINDIIAEAESKNKEDNIIDEEEEYEETTTAAELQDFEKDFEKWKREGSKQLKYLTQFTDVLCPEELKKLICGLNNQQRKIFDDIMERETCIGVEKEPYFVFISGEAGTGKSHLTRVLMEALKSLNIFSGKEINKPSILAIAPTANAAFIIGGKTIESALGLDGSNYNYKKLPAEREADLKYQYDEVSAIFIDEISMVGSGKLAKINYRLQDIAEGPNKKLFMGGKSCIVTGDMYQLPPVKDSYIFSNTKLDQRPECAPSHWDENFKIYYLTEKMRSKGDDKFGEVCDRIGTDTITDEDEVYLRNLVRENPNENNNEKFKEGKISIIVTTNYKREHINANKLNTLIPEETLFLNEAVDRCTNLQNAPSPPEDLTYTKAKGLPTKILLKVGAPILITVNDLKYKEDGVVNGARGHIDSFQMEENDSTTIKIIWVVFRDENVGKRLRLDKYDVKGSHKTTNPLAVPIEATKTRFELNHGNHKYVRKQFPVILAYAVTAHKSQGESLEEVCVDFTTDEKNKKPYIIAGSFYVAITRATKSENVYLKDFDRNYIKCNPSIAEKIDSMRIIRPYRFKKYYNEDNIFNEEGKEIKIGYLNINGLLDSEHYEYLNNDKNLLYLDILVLAETKLTKAEENIDLAEKLHQFKLLKRFDANDGMRHMGLLMVSPKKSTYTSFDPSMLEGFKDEHCQGFVYGFMKPLYLRVCFVYIRPGAGNKKQINHMLQYYDCSKCDIIMGDLNLNPRNDTERERINQLCHEDLEIALQEETTTKTKNQVDHILVSRRLKKRVFVTTYYNFVSDHKGIVARIGINDNLLKDEVISNFQNTSEKFMKKSPDTEGISQKSNYKFHQDVLQGKKKNSNADELSSLEGTNWLTSDVINEYGNIIKGQFKNSFVFSTYFFSSVRNRGEDSIRGWTQNTNIFEKDFVFFPVHENAHWYLIILKNREKTMEVLDPYKPLFHILANNTNQKTFDQTKKKIKERISSEHQDKINVILKQLLQKQSWYENNSYTVNIRHDIPEQKNEWDCGVFLLMFMKFTVLNKPFNFETNDMANFRQTIKMEIENHKIDEDISIVEDQNEDEYISDEEHLNTESMEIEEEEIVSEYRPPMFENESGSICWLNSIVQLFLLIIDQNHEDSILKRMFRNCLNIYNVQSNESLRRLLSEKKPELRNGQQDSFDFFSAITNFDDSDKEWLLNPLTLYTKTTTICKNNIMHQSSAFHNVPDYYLSVDIPRDNTPIQDLIEREFTTGQIINDWKCSRCDLYGGTKIKTIQNGLEPNYILVKLKRAEMDMYGRCFKNNKDIIPPLGFIVESENDNAIAYSLCGVLTHLGRSLSSGHYICEVRKNTKWWNCNDSRISETSFDNLSKQGYGFLFEKM